MSARVENSGEFGMGVWLQFGRGEVGWKRRRRRNRVRECRQMRAYNGFFRRNHRRNTSVGYSVGDVVGDSATSLYGHLSLNPSVISVGKIAWRHHVVAYFQTSCITRRRNRRYIPTGSPTELFRRYIPTDFEMELFPSVYITDGKIPSVIPLLFSGFLVVIQVSWPESRVWQIKSSWQITWEDLSF